MPAPDTISADKFARLIGLPNAPRIIDVRSDDDVARDPRLIPGAVRRPHAIPLYDALYRFCRDATDETHDWTSHGRARREAATPQASR